MKRTHRNASQSATSSHAPRRLLRFGALSALALIAACAGDPSDKTGTHEPPATGVDGDDGLDDGLDEAAGDAGGMRLIGRDGWGPVAITTHATFDQSGAPIGPPARTFPSSAWICDDASIAANGDDVTQRWSGCQFDAAAQAAGYTGDFDVIVELEALADGERALEMWLDTRLDVGVGQFRYVMRVDPETLPHEDEDWRVLFGYDDYISDPLNSLRTKLEGIAWKYQVLADEGEGSERFFVRNRLKTTSMMSVHTPSWGVMVHETDPDNAEPGWLMVGSNPDDDGVMSLEIGYHHYVPQSMLAGNGIDGPIKIGSTLRAKTLPAERSMDTAYWESVEAYRGYLQDETDLLPPLGLHQRPYPANWADKCLFAVWNVDGAGEKTKFVDELHTVAAAYQSEAGDEPLVLCPMLWGFHTVAPYQPQDGNIELAQMLQAAAADLGIELHLGAYYLPQVMDYERANADLRDGARRNLDGSERRRMVHGEEVVDAQQAHPAVRAEVVRSMTENRQYGIEWVYHDSPFGEFETDPQQFFGPHREIHAATRRMVQLMADTATDLGGGLVLIEMGRLGLDAVQAGGGGISYPLIAGGQPSKAADALYHGHHLTGYAGDIVSEALNIAFADSAADSILCPNPDIPCDFDPGRDDNMRHIPQLAMTAAFGRSVTDHTLLRTTTGDPRFDGALAAYGTALRNAYWTRRQTPALRTGRMLPAPPSDGGHVSMAGRLVNIPDSVYFKQIFDRRLERYPTGLFEDIENGGQLVLVVGNPESDAATVRYTLDRAEYPNLGAASDITGATAQDDGQSIVLEVDVPSLGFTVVTLPKS